MSPSPIPVVGGDVALRSRKARNVTSARIQSLARTGAQGGLLTPREIKEICMAILVEAPKSKVP